MKETTPVFVVGSGRCGTRMIYQMLKGEPDITVYHEYNCELVQRTSCLRYMNYYDSSTTKAILSDVYKSAVEYSNDRLWIDSSNKASWVISELCELMPNAKFIHLLRDGRKVTTSFLHKLGQEIYDDESVQRLYEWINDQSKLMPPLEKKYWWNIYSDIPDFMKLSQFEKICHHWSISNYWIEKQLESVPDNRKIRFQLEDLTNDYNRLADLLGFLGIKYDDKFTKFLVEPQNAIIPMNFRMIGKECEQFANICGQTMEHFEYDMQEQEYKVHYVL